MTVILYEPCVGFESNIERWYSGEVKMSENEQKSENQSFSEVNCSLKTKSRQMCECMVFEENIWAFRVLNLI